MISHKESDSTSVVYNIYTKKKEENPLVFLGINGCEMSNNNSYQHQQRVHRQRVCKVGAFDKDGKTQKSLNSFSFNIKECEMLESNITQVSTPQIDEPVIDLWCRNCGALNREVRYTAGCMYCHSKKLLPSDEDQRVMDYGDADDNEDAQAFMSFKKLEASEKLGSQDPFNIVGGVVPYEQSASTCPHGIRTVKIESFVLINNKSAISDAQREYNEIQSQICNIDNCLKSKDPIIANWARKMHRLVTDEAHVTGYKQVAINTWNKILRDNEALLSSLDYKFQFNTPTLQPKELGNWTWNFRSADTPEKKLAMFVKAIPKEAQYETFEYINNEYDDEGVCVKSTPTIEMYGDTKYVPEGDIARYNARQNWNMEYMEELTSLEHGVSTDFDGDPIQKVHIMQNAHVGDYLSHLYKEEQIKKSQQVFVFGSNRQGRHGQGSAKTAYVRHGAVYYNGEGIQGNSYAIPTKETPYKTLPLEAIKEHVETFIAFAKANPDKTFNVVDIGCGRAGYTPSQIAPMFENAPSNVVLSDKFNFVLNRQ